MKPFAAALLDPDAPLPPGLAAPENRPAGRRFAVYRNNVVVSLKEALEAGFPVIRKLVGAQFFDAMAGLFVRAHPPSSPVLACYGTEFPGFLARFGPVAHLPYLADTARLELALREAYHAADASPIRPEALAVRGLEEARLILAPATRLIISPYPVFTIWRANTEPDAPQARGGAEAVLITRPDWDPHPVPLSAQTARFIAALLAGETLGDALDAAGGGHDLAATLTLLLDTNSIAAIGGTR